MDTLSIRSWFGELFNWQNPLKTRLVRFFIREKHLKNIVLKILGFNGDTVKSKNWHTFMNNGYLFLKPLSKKKLAITLDDLKKMQFIPAVGELPKLSGEILLKGLNSKSKDAEIVAQIYRNLNVINESKVIKEIANDKQILNLVSEYLGTNKIIIDSQVWFTFSDNVSKHKSKKYNFGWHYDIDDLHWVKVFIYLNDVDSFSGPHEFIEGSHMLSGFKKIINRRVENEVKFKSLNLQNLKVIQFKGKAGTSFIEDTFGYHRGLNPIKSRAILQFTYRIGVI